MVPTSPGTTLTAVVLGLLVVAACAKQLAFDFDNDMENWNSYRGSWQWADRDNLVNTLPGSAENGFVIMKEAFHSDELYTPYFDVSLGINFTMKFFLRTRWVGSGNMYVDLYEQGRPKENFLDLQKYATPDTDSWITVTGEVPPKTNPILLSVFCYNGEAAPAGELMYGCAVDQIIVDVYSDQTTVASTTTTTTAATITTVVSTTGVPTGTPTDVVPTGTPTDVVPTGTPTDVVPTGPPTDVPTGPPTDVVPTGTPTDVPTSTPTEVSTTVEPSGPLVFDFQSSSQGWAMSLMNGATWRRVVFDSGSTTVGRPPAGEWVLRIFSLDIFSGTVLAQSPLLEAVSDKMSITITFWMDGDIEFPSDLKIRRTQGFNNFDEAPLVNLDAYGDQENHRWITYSVGLGYLTIGETFSIILEGSLGGNQNNSVAVNRVELEGVKVVPVEPSNFFDFEDGLSGWSQGNMEGGRWTLKKWSEIDPYLQVPKPTDGENFLFVERFDIHSGVITLESPNLPLTARQRKKLHIKFWTRGSVVYPAVLRLRKKSSTGEYDNLPFLNLAPYGDTNNSDWIELDAEYYIPISDRDDGFQLVLEADLGSDLRNLVAVDDLRIITEVVG